MPSIIQSSVIAHAVAGDSAACAKLLKTCRPLLRLVAQRHCREMLRARFDESDIVQLTCMEAHRALPEFRGKTASELLAWLNTILRRTIWRLDNEHTAQQRDVAREFIPTANEESLSFIWNTLPAHGKGPASRLIMGEAALAVAAALDKLPDDYRAVLEMRFLDSMKLKEIANQKQTTVGAVAGNLRRGLEMLQQLLPPDMAQELQS
ncbi:sigma-70 family RNA polymerase sigma factor [Fuerstiella marisgermanici]|nr:sigma-70 family RNA polymerase sigma factor [Fuerstiella marisgermanici]